jgi:NADH-quinone oxidoreductase subunit G
VRFCSEITKTGELTVSNRGDHVTIETFPGMPLDNLYSGNTVDICPSAPSRSSSSASSSASGS